MDEDGRFFKFVAIILIIVIGFNSGLKNKLKKDYDDSSERNSIDYADEIEEYNDYIEEYAEYVNSLDLNYLQTIMKVMSDEWENIEYGEVDNLINGYLRLSFQEEQKGVCTNFSDDFTAKINAINPEFNAKNVMCYVSDDFGDEIKTVNIQRNISENTETINTSSFRTKIYGNHMVSAINIPGKDYILAVDSTNLLIGLLNDGEIYIFNAGDEETMKFISKSTYIFGGENYMTYSDTKYDFTESVESLKDEWGYEAQEEALDYVDSLENESAFVKN